jgi:ribokinase
VWRTRKALQFGPNDVLLLQLEVPVEAILAAAERAKAAGAKVLLNYAPFRADALAVLPHATHLVVNESECALIAAALEIEAASVTDQATELGLRLGASVIATLGKDGVFAVENGRIEMAAALPVQAVDTVGAGDTFCGYLAAALSEEMLLGAALALASAAGSLACTKSGAQPAIPARRDVQAALDELSP